ncbi:MAG: DUF4105 domain-containing protein [Croceivirga sp.]
MKGLLVTLLIVLLSLQMFGQEVPQLSNNAQISILTCGPGNQLYTAFGHTAFRVQDPIIGLDVVYNYGTFDFNRPNFYLNFTKGKLIYSLSRRSFERFLFEYEYEKRWVKEQILNLSTKEVNDLFQFFEDNYRPENRDYRYDPLFNNCSNISGIILDEQLKDTIVFKGDHLKKPSSFRDLVREYISLNTWGSFGIELAFGGITDRTANIRDHLFLPDYAMRQFRNTLKNSKPLVRRERTILNYPESEYNIMFTLSPLFWFILLLGFVVVVTYLDIKHGSRNRWLDFVLFLLSGLIGTGILLLWLATDHQVTKLNFNFLWLLPSNAIVAFYVLRRQPNIRWLKKYIWAAFGGVGFILLIWIVGLQSISPLSLLLMLALMSRYGLLLKRG